jgi:hypothetical protein
MAGQRERNVENNTQRERLDHRDVHSPKWGTQFPGMRARCNLVLGFSRKWERETTAQRARRTHRGREDLKGRLAGGGWWLEAHWGGGTSLWASERVALSRIRSTSKAAQIPEESWESKVSAGNSTWSRVSAPNVRKNTALKERSWENSHP